MTNPFLAALQNQAQTISTNRSTVAPLRNVAPMQNYEPNPLRVTVDLVLNRHRLDVFFSHKPSEDILQALRDHGFHYRPSDKAWYHKDTEENRLFLENRFGASFIDSGDVEPSEDFRNDPIPESRVIAEPSDKFEQYKRQVKDLCEALKIDSADLVLLAISKLHDQTFT